MELPKRALGKTGMEITILGLGGEGVLRTFGREREAYSLINRAVDLGINYFESARAYSGSETYYGLALKERRDHIFLTSKSHARDKRGALDHLHETLNNTQNVKDPILNFLVEIEKTLHRLAQNPSADNEKTMEQAADIIEFTSEIVELFGGKSV